MLSTEKIFGWTEVRRRALRQRSGGLFAAPKDAVPERVAVSNRTKRAHDDGPGEQARRAPWAEAPGPRPDDCRCRHSEQGSADTADDVRSSVGRWFWVDSGLVAHRARTWIGTDDDIGLDASSRAGSGRRRAMAFECTPPQMYETGRGGAPNE